MIINDYSVRGGSVKVWFTYSDESYTILLCTANVSSLIEKILNNKIDWVKD